MKTAQGLIEINQEGRQAFTRFIMFFIIFIYIIFTDFDINQKYMINERGKEIILYLIVFATAVCIPYFHSLYKPTTSLLRRIATMLLDYSFLSIALIIGGEDYLAAYALILWVTVGNGMRFGFIQLGFATALALICMGLVYAFTPYWQDNPRLSLTLFAATVIVPAYTLALLRQTARAHQAAIAASVAKNRFLAQASHDLRQPIHAIGLLTETIRNSGLSPAQANIVQRIDRSLDSLTRLFRSLMDISMIDAGSMSMTIERVCLAEVLEDVATQNMQAARWADVDLKVMPTTAWAATDRTIVTTMVQNLVSNAIKYAPGRSVLVGVRRRELNHIAIEVIDRGPGIPLPELDKIFDEFYRFHRPGDKDVDGIGLGLAIVNRLGNLLGLSVRVASIEGRGSRFVIDGLKLCPPGVRQAVNTAPRAICVDNFRILLIEDDTDVRATTTELLQRWGCVVDSRSTVPDAPITCDLIISDFDLGGLTGADCIARIRTLAGRAIPAVIITGHDVKSVRGQVSSGDILVLSKPIDPKALRVVVNTFFERKCLPFKDASP